MSLDRFGPFAKVFTPGELQSPGHLALLGLGGKDAPTVIERVARAMVESDPRPWIETMLNDRDWRPHLVAAIAYLLDSEYRLDRILLWRAMDAGSWVTPQLCVTACYTDHGFVAAARFRIARQWPVSVPGGLTPAERHSATGPQASAERPAKMLVSLLSACDEIPSLASWVASVRSEPAILPLLSATASDNAAGIVASWRSELRLLFHARGIELRPKGA